MSSLLEDASAFHGHLGPYLVLGMRMGSLARRILNATPFEIRAEIHTEGRTPRSCILDGIQFTSGCTLGKRNIALIESTELFGVFYKNDTSLRITVKKEITERIAEAKDIEECAKDFFEKDDTELFEYDTPEKC